MGHGYRAQLRARNEVVEYTDEVDTYWFDVALVDKTWKLYLPGSRGVMGKTHELDAEEERRVLPRLVEYLSTIKWFWLYGGPFSVEIERRAP